MKFLANPVGEQRLVVLPAEVSGGLPSRGMVMTEGTVDGHAFRLPVEPNGQGSHWFRIPGSIPTHGEVEIDIFPSQNWTEPLVPDDLAHEFDQDQAMKATWDSLTPAARWDWIRWLSSAKQATTRAKRTESIASRMRDGKRRPCCFDRNQATLTDA